MIYLSFNLRNASEDGKAEPRAYLTLLKAQMSRLKFYCADAYCQVIEIRSDTGKKTDDEVVFGFSNMDALTEFIQLELQGEQAFIWLTGRNGILWKLVSLTHDENRGLQVVPSSDDDQSLQGLIVHLEEQERIKAVKSQIREAALLLNQKLSSLPHGSIIIDDDFLKRVATANGMLREHDIDDTEIGNGVSHASALEYATENVVGYRRETLSVDKLLAEYQGLLQEFETTDKSQPAGE